MNNNMQDDRNQFIDADEMVKRVMAGELIIVMVRQEGDRFHVNRLVSTAQEYMNELMPQGQLFSIVKLPAQRGLPAMELWLVWETPKPAHNIVNGLISVVMDEVAAERGGKVQ